MYLKTSRARKYIHKQNKNTLRNMPESAKSLLEVYESLVGGKKKDVSR